MESFFFVLAALFSVLNPIGTVPIFVALTQELSAKDRSRIALMTGFNVLLILLISYFVGQYILQFLGISISALRIAGGLIIASSGFALLNGKFNKERGMNKEVAQDAQTRSGLALTPLAMPMLAGPGSISLLIAQYQEAHHWLDMLSCVCAIVVVSAGIFLILRSAHFLAKGLGASGIVAISRIVGFLTIAIGIQYIIHSVLFLIQSI
ncbi:MAG: antibiotic resistance protein MarC [Flavobacterium sp. BFFFF2]|nr:MAG: antibiotic resistance protein MarC [Flavobacterium sp. BFFFF2]